MKRKTKSINRICMGEFKRPQNRISLGLDQIFSPAISHQSFLTVNFTEGNYYSL